MSKKRKTREQKIASSQRREQLFSQISSQPSSSVTYTLPTSITTPLRTIPAHHSTHSSHDYSYVTHDMRNTFYVTSALLLLNVVIYFLMKMNIIHLTF